MANVFNVSVTTYGNWERGDKEPSIETIGCICKHFNVSADWLLGITDAPSVPVIAAKIKQAGESDAYWRELAVSQQETIAKLTAMLAEGRASAVGHARAGGHTATKTA